jgi:hypothetical protein
VKYDDLRWETEKKVREELVKGDTESELKTLEKREGSDVGL